MASACKQRESPWTGGPGRYLLLVLRHQGIPTGTVTDFSFQLLSEDRTVPVEKNSMSKTAADITKSGVQDDVCVVIISTAAHVELLPRALRSATAEQTMSPSSLVISLSGVTPEQCSTSTAALRALLVVDAPQVVLLMLCSQTPHNSAMNRNRGARGCRTRNATFVSYLDADDVMLPQRLGVMTSLMRRHAADLGLHSFVGAVGCCHSPANIISPDASATHFASLPRCRHPHFRTTCPTSHRSLSCRLHDTCESLRCALSTSCIHFLPGSLQRIHFGHATVRTAVFEVITQREDTLYRRAEDSWFARDISALGMRVVVTDAALTCYNRSSGLARATLHGSKVAPLPAPMAAQSAAEPSTSAEQGINEPSTSAAESKALIAPVIAPVVSMHGDGGGRGGGFDGHGGGDGGGSSLKTRGRRAAGRASTVQAAIDEAIHCHQCSWRPLAEAGFVWHPFQASYAAVPCLFHHRHLVFAGDSTVRDLYSSQLISAPRSEPWASTAEWRASPLGCNATLGSGCADCWACCAPACATDAATRGGRRAFIPYSKRVALAVYVRHGWEDVEHRSEASATTASFSWKPELFSQADTTAFRARFCAENAAAVPPPDLLYVGKGLHDSCRHNVSSIAAHREHATRRLHQLAEQLRCLPPSTVVVLRTPYFVANSSSAASRVCLRAQEEPSRVALVRDVMIEMHRQGVFGPRAVLLDAFTLTRAAHELGESSMRSLDGHHYPTSIQALEWKLLSFVFERMMNKAASSSSSKGREAQTTASCGQAPKL